MTQEELDAARDELRSDRSVVAFRRMALRHAKYVRARPLPVAARVDGFDELVGEFLSLLKRDDDLASLAAADPRVRWGFENLARESLSESDKFVIEDHLLRIRSFVEPPSDRNQGGYLIEVQDVLSSYLENIDDPAVVDAHRQLGILMERLALDDDRPLARVSSGDWRDAPIGAVIRDLMYGIVAHANLRRLDRVLSAQGDVAWWEARHYAMHAQTTIEYADIELGRILGCLEP